MKKLLIAPILAALISIACIVGLTHIKIDNRATAFLPQDHPAVVSNNEHLNTFGSNSPLIIGLISSGNILEQLPAVVELSSWLEEQSYIANVLSLSNAPHAYVKDGTIVQEPLYTNDIVELRRKLEEASHYKRVLYSEDFRATALILRLKESVIREGASPSIDLITQKTEEVANRYNLDTAIGGELAINAYMGKVMIKDMVILAPLVALVLCLLLLLSLRRIRYTVLVLLSVAMGSVWAVGAMGLLGIPMTMISVAIPTLMVAVGSAYGIHVISHYEELRKMHSTLEGSREGREELVKMAKHTVKKPVMLAALTTMVGFASLISSTLIPIRYFGFFAAFGVAVSVVAALLLIPTALICLPPFKTNTARAPRGLVVDHVLRGAEGVLARPLGRGIILLVVLLLVGSSILAVKDLRIDNSLIKFFRPNTPVAKADAFLREHMLGSSAFSLVIASDSPAQNLLSRPSLLALDRIAIRTAALSDKITSTTGVPLMYKQMNMLMHSEGMTQDLAASANQEPAGDSFGDDGFEGGFGEGFGSGFGDDPVVDEASVEASPADAQALQPSPAIGVHADLEPKDFFEIPLDPAKYGMQDEEELDALVEQYGLLLAGSYGEFANDGIKPTQVQMIVTLNTTSAREDHELMQEIEQIASEELSQGMRYWTTGPSKISWMLTEIVATTQIVSVLVSLVLVALLLLWQFRSLVLALVGLVPLSLSVLLVFAAMSFAHMELNIGTALVASIAIGIGVDYTIHYIQAYVRARSRVERHLILRESYATTGRAILYNALSVALGFLVLAASQFTTIQYVGILVALTMLSSSLGALFVLPMLLQWLPERFVRS